MHKVGYGKVEDGFARFEPLNLGSSVNSVHTRCIVKTSGFTRGVCKNRGFY